MDILFRAHSLMVISSTFYLRVELMTIGLVGRKVGMTRIFSEADGSIPVTVIHVAPCHVTQVKGEEVDGYRAIQVTVGARKPSKVNKPLAGHYAKAGVEAGRGLWEFRLQANEGVDLQLGTEITANLFKVGQRVDVTGISKGKGYAGTVKRHNFRSQDDSHGNSVSHRAPGSIGQCQTPGRVFKGKKMAGQLGAARTTAQNLEVVRVDEERDLLLIKGAVPGAKGGDIIVRPTVKAKGQ
jgi:large subunit ribosomal protein L3